MAFQVYDFREVNRNVLITPEIRARLYHMKPGQVDSRHSHDLGHEIFLILEGSASFEIEGHTEILGPGQMCIALVNEIHQVKNVLPDKPTIMYLSVTPHIEPTHTRYADAERRVRAETPEFNKPSRYHAEDDSRPTDEILDDYLCASQAVADSAAAYAETQSTRAAQWRAAINSGDASAAVQARNAMSEALTDLYAKLFSASGIWNGLAPKGNEPTPS